MITGKQRPPVSLLTHIETQKLEREFVMGGGTVLEFSNRTFASFFREVVRVDIYGSQYELASGSKANRLRAFWSVATKEQLCLFFEGILKAWSLHSKSPISSDGQTLIERIIARMGGKAVDSPPESTGSAVISKELSDSLNAELIALTALTPQKRGFAFEVFLRHLFDAYGLSARASFRNAGEQIDGSFVLHNETYLFEAKWQNSPTPAEDLHTFEGKLGQKASWSRGLFISISGFTPDGLTAFGRGKRLICMDGLDLFEILNRRMSLVDVLSAKIRIAAETGAPFTRVRELPLR